MNKAESYGHGHGQYHTSGESENAFEKKSNCNRDRQGGTASSYTNPQININDHADKSDNELPPSASYLTRKYYSPYLNKDYTINSCNHYQDLNDKFQQLESKMFEVEKCFKEANRLEMVGSEKHNDFNDIASSPKSIHNIENLTGVQKPNKVVINETRNVTDSFEGNTFRVGNHNVSSDAGGCENEVVKDKMGNGDINQLERSATNSSKNLSDDSCNTMINSSEKPSYQLPNRRTMTKSYLTMKRYDDHNEPPHELPATINHNKLKHQLPKNDYFEENLKLTDVDLLEKSKKLILCLIDKELQKIETKPHKSKSNQMSRVTPDNNHRRLKVECIQNIEKELKTLKQLESMEL